MSSEKDVRRICDTFETLWRTGGLPSIDEAMSQYDGADRERLLLDLICLDVRFRLARGISVPADL